jgi:hypothetical protein
MTTISEEQRMTFKLEINVGSKSDYRTLWTTCDVQQALYKIADGFSAGEQLGDILDRDGNRIVRMWVEPDPPTLAFGIAVYDVNNETAGFAVVDSAGKKIHKRPYKTLNGAARKVCRAQRDLEVRVAEIRNGKSLLNTSNSPTGTAT